MSPLIGIVCGFLIVQTIDAIAVTAPAVPIMSVSKLSVAVDDVILPPRSGAGPAYDAPARTGRTRQVASVETLRQTIDSAAPGDVILLMPGTYRISQSVIAILRPGKQDSPVTVQARIPGSVVLESELPEALKVEAPYWRFENLILKGVCANDTICDNGFHIVGHAEHTTIQNVTIEDFNAQIKINGENGYFPDGGLIRHTTLLNSHARQTSASVTPIDLVAASDWSIEDNLIADFAKDGGDHVSYGAFAKGAGGGTRFARNVVLCAWHLHAARSTTVGLSLGGGGTDRPVTRDNGRSGYEHWNGVMSENLIAFCSDVGIYLNRSANSVVRHNTLIGTSGIDARYPETIAHVDANIMDGTIRARDGGKVLERDNESGSVSAIFASPEPSGIFFVDPSRLDLRWKRLPPMVATNPGVDLCGMEWAAVSAAGAFQDFRACGTAKSP